MGNKSYKINLDDPHVPIVTSYYILSFSDIKFICSISRSA